MRSAACWASGRSPPGTAPASPSTATTRPHAARLRQLADQEITRLLRRVGDDLALDVLGLLTAAIGGPLAVADLATMTGSPPWKVRGVLDGQAARTLQQVGPADTPRYTFAHETLLARCQDHGVGDLGHARRIEEWAATWCVPEKLQNFFIASPLRWGKRLYRSTRP